ncbi:MAG TPA: GTP-binding protein [Isosphaeraceae bacterium]|nr:GTP-binding protein [Isosphaeraceae bacterium]
MRKARLGIAACLALGVAFGATAWLIAGVGELHDRLAKVSPGLASGVIVFAVVAASLCGIAAARLMWSMGHGRESRPVRAPDDIVQAADVQADKAEGVIAQLSSEQARDRLRKELEKIRADRRARTFHVVIFGTGSAGKTSLINALLGRDAGETAVTMGTTRRGEVHSYELDDVEGTVVLTDTPGLSEIGDAGASREAEARDLAARADLLLFVVDHDLIRSEFEPMLALAKQGKRSIVVLNKKDRLLDSDREAILAKLRERLGGLVAPSDVIAVAAAPRPVAVRVVRTDGTVEVEHEAEPPDLGPLRDRIGAVLEREGDALRAGNLLLRAHLLSKSAQDEVSMERDAKARAVIDRFQWITASTVFTNPIPALDLMATGAVQFQMISEIAAAYGVTMNSAHARMVGSQMIQLLLKLGLVEATTSLVAGLFKSTLVGYAAGGAVQGVSMAYLTHISGRTFMDYFRRGQEWGDGGMQAALVRQFDLTSRADFLAEFAKQAMQKVASRVFGPRAEKKA